MYKILIVMLLFLSVLVLYSQENDLVDIKLEIPKDSTQTKTDATTEKDKAEEFLKSSHRIGLFKYNDKETEFPYSSFSSDIISVNYGFMRIGERILRNINIQYNTYDSKTPMIQGVKTEGKGIKFSKLLSILKKEFGKYDKEKRNFAVIYKFKDEYGDKIRLINNTRANRANLSFMLNTDGSGKKNKKDPLSFFGPDQVPFFKGSVSFDQVVDALKKLYNLENTDKPDMSASGPAFNKSLDFFNGKGKTCLRIYMPFRMARTRFMGRDRSAESHPSTTLKAGAKIKAEGWKKPKDLYTSKGVMEKFTIYGVVANQDAIFKFDPETGESTIIGSLGFNVGNSSLSFHPDGTLWGFSDDIPFGCTGKLYTVNLKTGKGTIVKEFPNSGGRGLEWDKEGENLYWISSRVSLLDIKNGRIKKVMDLPKGITSLSLGRRPNGNFLGISTLNHELFELDMKKKKIKILSKLKFDGRPPALAITPNNRIFFSTVQNDMYYMKNLNADPVLLGKPGVSPWGMAIQPKFNMKDDNKFY